MRMAKLFLLADDDIDDAELFNEAVMKIDPPVDFHHVDDGRDVFQFLENDKGKKPDIIFLDINMLQVTGWECLLLLKQNEEYHSIPVIMYTTSASNLDKEKAKKLGASGFLTKPSDFRVLVSILRGFANSESISLWGL